MPGLTDASQNKTVKSSENTNSKEDKVKELMFDKYNKGDST